MTKKQMFEAIANRLKETGKAVCVKDFGYELRSGFGAMKAYEIKYQRENIDGLQTDSLYCYPWAGANVMWRTDFFRLNKQQIQTIYDRVCKAD